MLKAFENRFVATSRVKKLSFFWILNNTFLNIHVDCGSAGQNLADDFCVSVEAWHLLNTHSDYKNGTFWVPFVQYTDYIQTLLK